MKIWKDLQHSSTYGLKLRAISLAMVGIFAFHMIGAEAAHATLSAGADPGKQVLGDTAIQNPDSVMDNAGNEWDVVAQSVDPEAQAQAS